MAAVRLGTLTTPGRMFPVITCHLRSSDIAYALFSFPSLAAYENYRTAIRQDPEAQELWKLSEETRCIRRFDRTFLRPAFKPSEATETS